ncbi:MAG TPA: putative ABC exporter domain-containing protein [Gemmatimonadales bacterium]|jgi:hypothetical protein|nr:putative ABC exporter domain-containing protein [Gemmatimonadales bacterium]
MIGAAVYLIRRSLVNATRRRVARLRQPKYLIGFVVGSLYLYWLVLRPRAPTGVPTGGAVGGELLGVGLLAVLVGLNWLFGSAETPFSFSLAETQYLFPAPLTRRQVIDFKLLRSQLPLLLSAVVTALIFSSGHVSALRALRVIGLWVVYATLQLHYAGTALLRASLTQHGVTGWRRQLGTLVALGSVVLLGWWGVRQAVPGVVAAFQRGATPGSAALASALHAGVLGVLLWPLRAVVALPLADGAAAFARQAPAALVVLAAHYLWVVRSTLGFEEAAVEHAVKVARKLEAMRQGRSPYRAIRAPRAPGRIRLRLAPTGAPSRAIVWKNAVGATRDLSPWTFLLIAGLAIGGPLGLTGGSIIGWDILAVILLVLGSVALLFGPLTVRFDLRRDLEMLDVLRGYPVRGRQIVGGEVAAPVTLIGLVVWTCLAGGFAASAGHHGPGLPPLADRLAIFLALLPATAAVLLVLVLVQNAVVLLFPAWVSIGRDRAVGLEATGQRILLMAGGMVALALALVPGAIIGALTALAAELVGLPGLWWVTLGAAAGSGVVVFEGLLAVHLLGGVFDRLEPAATGVG